MKTSINTVAFIPLLVLTFSCSKGPKAPEAEAGTIVGRLRMDRQEGIDCDKPDTLRVNCVRIDLSWPNVEEGSEGLKKSVETWGHSYLTGILMPETPADSATVVSVGAAADDFVRTHEEFSKEAPDSPLGQWVAECKGNTLLNDGKHLTLEIEGYVFSGGAHGSPTATVATFETATGKQLSWDDLVTDKAALQALAEKKFRQVKAEAFEGGFEFDDTFPFALPQNYGLTEEGIYFRYLHYEVGPYAMGDAVFTIPFSELGGLYKLK